MKYYQMLENLHVVSNNKERDDMNFWSQEVYIANLIFLKPV